MKAMVAFVYPEILANTNLQLFMVQAYDMFPNETYTSQVLII